MRLPCKPLLAALLCLLIASCGGGAGSPDRTTATFKTGYEKLRGGLNQTGVAVATELGQAPHQTGAQVASAFGALATSFHAQLTQLEALKPPQSLRAAFAGATYAANKVDRDLNAIALAAGRHSARGARQATQALGRDITAMKTDAAMIKRGLAIK